MTLKYLVFFVFLVAGSVLAAERITSVQVGAHQITGIRDVYTTSGGRIAVVGRDGLAILDEDGFPDKFLESWGINKAKVKERRDQKSQADLEAAIAGGCFRQVEGLVYDLRKDQPSWKQLSDLKPVRMEDNIVVATPLSTNSNSVVVIRHLAAVAADGQIDCRAKRLGSMRFYDAFGKRRTVICYDAGVACKREEIPASLLNGDRAWARKLMRGETGESALDALPNSERLRGCGSGFFITEDGDMVTAAHVVEGAQSVKVKIRDQVLDARVVKIDAAADLALLKVSGSFSCLALDERSEAALGETAFTIGFPNIELQGLEPKYTAGTISSLKGMHDDQSCYQISVPIQPGNSGGPLVAANGCVVGVVIAKLNDMAMLRSLGSVPQNVNYAVKSSCLKSFLLDQRQVAFSLARQPRPGPAANSAEETVSRAQKAAGLILVY